MQMFLIVFISVVIVFIITCAISISSTRTDTLYTSYKSVMAGL